MNIAICIATYKRPEGLKALLTSLAALVYDKSKIFVFIADNDAQTKAGHNFIQNHMQDFPFYIQSDIEAGAGISHARNKSLTLAKNSGKPFDLVAFLDDDSQVSPNWLLDLLTALTTYNADSVVGKIEPRFPPGAPMEMITSLFFQEFQTEHTGAEIKEGGTNHSIFRRKVFDDLGYEPFDLSLSLVGGEDTEGFLYFAINKKPFEEYKRT